MRNVSESRLWAALNDPLRGRTSLSRVVWVYGLLGSVVYSALGVLVDSGNAYVMHLYSVIGLVFSAYVTVATYRCADNGSSKFWARMARLSAILSLLLLPVIAYLDFTGALSLALIGGEQ